MFWSEISIRTTEEAVDAISNICIEMGATGIALQGSGKAVLITVYLPVNDLLSKKLEHIRRQVVGLSYFGLDAGECDITVKEIPEEDWAEGWKAHYKPISVGENILIKPTWYKASPEKLPDVIIEMDPGMAFGSGVHYTTHSVLDVLNRRLQRGQLVFDLGTGSGILSIAAAKLGAEKVIAMDIDPVAIKVAQENIELNDVSNKVFLKKRDILQFLKDNSYKGSVDIVLGNIIAQVIIEICPGVSQILKPGGLFIAAGIVNKFYTEVERAMIDSGFRIDEVLNDGEWVTLCAVRGG